MDELLLDATPVDIERRLGRRLREARKARGWTQAELARRSGLALNTVARFERSGQGQLSSLTRMSAALDRLDDFDALLKPRAPTTLDELRRRGGR